ncbi:MAG: hypothetical protein ABIJ97_11460 [Bacteroidota bacterium]
MQHIFDIHDYDENFLDQFTSQTIPIYDLWSIRPLQNEQKEIISGNSAEVTKFRNFIIDHSNRDFPHPLVIVIGNSEKSNPNNILNTTKRYFKIKFDKYKGTDLGSPLLYGNAQPYPTGSEQMLPLSFQSYGQRLPGNPAGFGGISYTEIQGIIDRNVTDATRSIKAEYEENSAKREAESIRRIAELEMKMELYKLELRAREVEEKEKRLQNEMDEFEDRKEKGLGTVREYTKTIAGGLLEVGKSVLGLDESGKFSGKEKKERTEKSKDSEDKNLKGSRTCEDSGFEEKKEKKAEENGDAFSDLLGVIKGLNEEQKMQLMDVLIPEEAEQHLSGDENNKQSNNKENNEDIQSDHND